MSKIIKREDAKVPVDVSEFSHANMFNAYMDKNGKHYYFNILKGLDFYGADIPFTAYRIMGGDTWPLISYKHYQNITLWWLLLAFNEIPNPVINPPTGSIIKIPTQEAVRAIIDTINRRK